MKNLDINARDSCGRTALVWVLECLAFEFEFNPNYRGSDTRNFETNDGIGIAHRRVVKALLSAGAKSHIPGYNADTPLHLASILGDVEIVQNLLDYGADTHTSKKYGYVPLVLAVRYGKVSIYMKLLDHGENGRTALIEAASVRDLALMEKLIRKKLLIMALAVICIAPWSLAYRAAKKSFILPIIKRNFKIATEAIDSGRKFRVRVISSLRSRFPAAILAAVVLQRESCSVVIENIK
ncbi:Calcium calmodulin-dependent kinase type 1B [Fusarium acutatum]|uniref:Calcium calmodulin-dependent kinase type 1B n=1 Tax=Fusarium acutatum TaxID=78861 RepID=A0A8H4JGF7_9HYPO|nr:Calcium calmodulin-dependent kinase type 1B [Fusarium acutatum]